MAMNEAQAEALLGLAAKHDPEVYEMQVDDAVRVTFEMSRHPYDFVDYTINSDGSVERGHSL